jgi:putative ABC transport system substrate-binding protein
MPSAITRRQLLLSTSAMGLGLLAGCGRLPWQAEPPPKAPRVGLLLQGTEGSLRRRLEAFHQGLREYGYLEGQNLVLERRFDNGLDERLPGLADDLVQLPVDVIVAAASNAVLAAKSATPTIPIVIVHSGDPVALGLVASLARPGGNVTGLSSVSRMLSGKRLELLRALIPGGSRVAFLWNILESGPSPALTLFFQETATAAPALGLELQAVPVRTADDLEQALDAATAEGAAALLVPLSPFLLENRARIIDLAAKHRLPAMYPVEDFAEAGGLMAYGPSLTGLYRRAAYYVDRILKGAKPADLPVEQPMTFEFIVNMKTARELGITFPNEIMLQVTEVIDQ